MSIASYIFTGEGWTNRKPKEFAMMNEYVDYFDLLKTKDKNSIFSNPEVKQIVSAVTGNEKIKKLECANKEEEKIANLYTRMLFALIIIRCCRGETLGIARQKSLEQMDEYVQSKVNSKDSVGKYLPNIKKQLHPAIAEINMKDKDNSNKQLKIDPNLAKAIEERFSKEFQQCLKSLNDISQQCTLEDTLGKENTQKQLVEQQKLDKQQKIAGFDNANQKTQQLMQQFWMQQMMHQRAA